MTSEVALLNRSAVALAADSATTISYIEGSQRKQRYFKGANKIFNLSDSHPVGIMIYQSASLQGVPWEAIIKCYRSHLGRNPHDYLTGYAADFFKYIENNEDLFSADFKKKKFINDALRSAHFLLFYIDVNERVHESEKSAEEKREIWGRLYPPVRSRIHSARFIGGASQGDVERSIVDNRDELKAALLDDDVVNMFREVIDFDDILLQAVTALHKEFFTVLDYTGIVIAGFGEKDYFPSVHLHKCYGMILGKVLSEQEEVREVSQENVSEILPLAQSEMANSFTHGIPKSITRLIDREFSGALERFEKSLSEEGIIAEAQDTLVMQAHARNIFSENIRLKLEETHTVPMKRVVGMLPVDELAELAEIFVKMESLKERVTRGTEQVSGPIDVAVITKGDGFVWIKRKHYFEPRLNPGYFTRRGVLRHE